MSLLEQEKSTLAEKNNNLTMDLANSNVEYERLKREYHARQEQDKENLNALNQELRNLRGQFEDTWWVTATVKEVNHAGDNVQVFVCNIQTLGVWF